MWTAAILAGGQARRLGGVDKAALAIGSKSILDLQLALLRPLTPHILIIGGGRRNAIPGDVRQVPDRYPGSGPLGGIVTALEAAPADPVLVLACDLPHLTAPFVTRLVQMADGDADVVVPRDLNGRHPLAAVYRRGVASQLAARISAGELRVLDAIAPLHVRELGPEELSRYDPRGRLLLNVNTPDDYTRAQQP
jgi:molybdopterin-guanine dinucleotide biosynthesis protein A